MIPDTSGPGLPTPFAWWDHDSSCWRMLQGTLLSDSTPYSPTLPKWGCLRNGELSELPMSAPRTDGSGSSLLPTPRSQMGEGRNSQAWLRPADQPQNLENAIATILLPTPTSEKVNAESQWLGQRDSGSKQQLNLATAVTHLLPTPTARDHKGPNQRNDATCLHGALLPTLTARLGAAGPDYRERPNGPDLQAAVRALTGDDSDQPSDAGNVFWDEPPLPLWSTEPDSSTPNSSSG